MNSVHSIRIRQKFSPDRRPWHGRHAVQLADVDQSILLRSSPVCYNGRGLPVPGVGSLDTSKDGPILRSWKTNGYCFQFNGPSTREMRIDRIVEACLGMRDLFHSLSKEKSILTDRINVLVTGVGGCGVGEGIAKSLLMVHEKYHVVAVNMHPDAPVLFRADAAYIVPPATDSAYIPNIQRICTQEQDTSSDPWIRG